MDADGRGLLSLLSISNSTPDLGKSTVAVLFAVLLLLLLSGAYFASAETAFASVNKIKIKTLSDQSDKKAMKALNIIENFDKALITLLIGNNISHITFSSIATIMAEKYFHNITVTVSTLISTLVIFFVAEMLPKSYAKANSEKLALRFAGSLSFFMFIFNPLGKFFSFISKLLSRLFIKNSKPTITEEELQDIIETMEEEGSFENEEKSELLQNAMEFDDVTASDILTSRVDTECVEISDSIDKILQFIKNTNHSRIPVYDKTPDNIIGILSVKSFLKSYIKDRENIKIENLLSSPLFVPGSTKIDDLFKKMTENKYYISVVTDEYGGTMGIVTIEDIVEELVGDIWDENDRVIEEIREISENKFRVLGDTNLGDFFDHCQIKQENDSESKKSFSALCGEMLETLPKEKDSFLYEGLKITVEKAIHNRIITLLVEILPTEKGDESDD